MSCGMTNFVSVIEFMWHSLVDVNSGLELCSENMPKCNTVHILIKLRPSSHCGGSLFLRCHVTAGCCLVL